MASYNLSAAGTIGVNSGLAALHVSIQVFPLIYQGGNARPINYYHVGLIRHGNSIGWYPPLPIDAVDMYVPVPADTVRFGYNVGDGGTIRVEEIFAPAVAAVRDQPWDRNPTPQNAGGQYYMPGGYADTVVVNWTVPAGRKFWLTRFAGRIQRFAPATANAYAQAVLVIGAALVGHAQISANTGDVNVYEPGPGPGGVYAAGTTFVARLANADTGGGVYGWAFLEGFTFDA